MTTPLPPETLRRTCPIDTLPFETTDDLETLDEIVAQDRAVQTITFGVGIRSAGFNLFALGPPGTGKATAVRRFLNREAAKLPTPADWCYVYNFADPHRPRAMRLASGRARVFQRDSDRLIDDVKTGIPRAFEAEPYAQQKNGIVQGAEKEQAQELAGRKERVEAKGFGLAKTPSGLIAVPILHGKPLDTETLKRMDESAQQEFRARYEAVQADLAATLRRFRELEKESRARLQALDREVASALVGQFVEEVKEKYADAPEIVGHLEAVREDIVEHADLFRRAASGQANPMEVLAMWTSLPLERAVPARVPAVSSRRPGLAGGSADECSARRLRVPGRKAARRADRRAPRGATALTPRTARARRNVPRPLNSGPGRGRPRTSRRSPATEPPAH